MDTQLPKHFFPRLKDAFSVRYCVSQITAREKVVSAKRIESARKRFHGTEAVTKTRDTD
jgi:hypothetical protein